MVCTRYAPSPTGYLHVGGARTALFNYLYAKKNNGKFILRIEDTDAQRNVPDGHIAMENSLKLLNIFPDESFSYPGTCGPYMQSQKLERYEEVCQTLLEEGKAYRCFCSEKELQEFRKKSLQNHETPTYSGKCRRLNDEEINRLLASGVPYTVRLKVDICPSYGWQDLVRGNIVQSSEIMSDNVIMRSNKLPTYNFASTVDDLDMQVTCILRGEEHIPNTFYQLALYHALDREEDIPSFGHLSLVVDENKAKLSKRSGHDIHSVDGLLQMGYVPEAVVNFMALLGWSHGEEEIFTMEELVNKFSVEGISKSPSYFDVQKLNWINHKYMQNMTDDSYWNFVAPIFNINLGKFEPRKKIFALVHRRHIDYAGQLNDLAKEFYRRKILTDEMIEMLKNARTLIESAVENFPPPKDEWNKIVIMNYLKQLCQISGLRGANLYKPLRVAFSLQLEGIELFNVLHCLGRDRARSNLIKCWKIIRDEQT